LNISYSGTGPWGNGIHLAANANYCCPANSYEVSNNTFEVFFANVVVGKYAYLGL
jgi:hypothetical protein